MASSQMGCLISIPGYLESQFLLVLHLHLWWLSGASPHQLGVRRIHSDARKPDRVGGLLALPLPTCPGMPGIAFPEHTSGTFAASLSWVSFFWDSPHPQDWELPMSFPQASLHSPGQHFLIWEREKKTRRFSPKHFVFITNPFYSFKDMYISKPWHWRNSLLSACFSHILSLRTGK